VHRACRHILVLRKVGTAQRVSADVVGVHRRRVPGAARGGVYSYTTTVRSPLRRGAGRDDVPAVPPVPPVRPAGLAGLDISLRFLSRASCRRRLLPYLLHRGDWRGACHTPRLRARDTPAVWRGPHPSRVAGPPYLLQPPTVPTLRPVRASRGGARQHAGGRHGASFSLIGARAGVIAAGKCDASRTPQTSCRRRPATRTPTWRRLRGTAR